MSVSEKMSDLQILVCEPLIEFYQIQTSMKTIKVIP